MKRFPAFLLMGLFFLVVISAAGQNKTVMGFAEPTAQLALESNFAQQVSAGNILFARYLKSAEFPPIHHSFGVELSTSLSSFAKI